MVRLRTTPDFSLGYVCAVRCKYSEPPLDGRAIARALYKRYTRHNRRNLWIHTAFIQDIFSGQNTGQDTLKLY
jgi:hypothetical protein